MNSLKGQLLIASPSLITPFFSRTVILMYAHDETGAVGLVINRPTQATVKGISEHVLEEYSDWDKLIYLGGPVPGPVMVLHTDPITSEAEVLPGVYTTAEPSEIRELIRKRAEPSLFVANYSGWGPGQLENEFGVDSWLTLPAKPEHVFIGTEELWDQVVKEVGTRRLYDFLNLREIPPDPRMN